MRGLRHPCAERFVRGAGSGFCEGRLPVEEPVEETVIEPAIERVVEPAIERAIDPAIEPVEELASIARMSPRNLTRVFRQATGITLKDYSTRIKLEMASNLLRNPDYTLERVAAECGFSDSRQLRRLWSKSFGESPSSWRSRDQRRAIA